jgi:hypothetical protein
LFGMGRGLGPWLNNPKSGVKVSKAVTGREGP